MADERTLYVLRHAKSDWNTAAATDFDRPLASRGERAVDVLAAHFQSESITPELILSSPARRAKQTIEGVLPDAYVAFDEDLYGAGVFDLLDVLRRVDGDIASVLVVGHNPGLHDLVEVLTDEEVDKFPTGGLATIRISPPWPELAPGGGVLRSLVGPRELE
jgi:phosphohistidine phosphatase